MCGEVGGFLLPRHQTQIQTLQTNLSSDRRQRWGASKKKEYLSVAHIWAAGVCGASRLSTDTRPRVGIPKWDYKVSQIMENKDFHCRNATSASVTKTSKQPHFCSCYLALFGVNLLCEMSSSSQEHHFESLIAVFSP